MHDAALRATDAPRIAPDARQGRQGFGHGGGLEAQREVRAVQGAPVARTHLFGGDRVPAVRFQARIEHAADAGLVQELPGEIVRQPGLALEAHAQAGQAQRGEFQGGGVGSGREQLAVRRQAVAQGLVAPQERAELQASAARQRAHARIRDHVHTELQRARREGGRARVVDHHQRASVVRAVRDARQIHHAQVDAAGRFQPDQAGVPETPARRVGQVAELEFHAEFRVDQQHLERARVQFFGNHHAVAGPQQARHGIHRRATGSQAERPGTPTRQACALERREPRFKRLERFRVFGLTGVDGERIESKGIVHSWAHLTLARGSVGIPTPEFRACAVTRAQTPSQTAILVFRNSCAGRSRDPGSGFEGRSAGLSGVEYEK